MKEKAREESPGEESSGRKCEESSIVVEAEERPDTEGGKEVDSEEGRAPSRQVLLQVPAERMPVLRVGEEGREEQESKEECVGHPNFMEAGRDGGDCPKIDFQPRGLESGGQFPEPWREVWHLCQTQRAKTWARKAQLNHPNVESF